MKYASLLFLLWVLQPVQAQQSVTRMGSEAQYGFIIPHASDLVPVSQTNPVGLSLRYDRMRLDKKRWDACNCFHYLGLRLTHHRFGNPDVLGHATTLAGSFEPILFRAARWQVSLASGMGASYLNRVYNETTNPENTFFSAPISFLLFVSPHIQYALTEKWSANIAFHYNHISNGGQRQPNRGMNFPTLGLGAYYYLQTPEFPGYLPEELNNRWNPYLEVFATMKNNPIANTRSPAVGTSIGAYRKVTGINALGGGWEGTWDQSLSAGTEKDDLINHGVFVAHHFLFGRFDFSQRMAFYLRKPENYQPDKSFYQRYAILYRLSKHLRAGASMKTHGHVAENIELRMGYVF
ncbi:acyloxyacyl hydrolase [Lunatimonas lonarensis]|uniref:acyloxyacyl hydrolase n=1 Tax=Lunatimonas lonarensis TaxID=1232681 RepID=UPI00055D7383|nr:acyloxyacyl hydrolase [Lunatimonas lonarensis]